MSCEYKLPVSEAQRKLAPGLRWPTCELLFKDPPLINNVNSAK